MSCATNSLKKDGKTYRRFYRTQSRLTSSLPNSHRIIPCCCEQFDPKFLKDLVEAAEAGTAKAYESRPKQAVEEDLRSVMKIKHTAETKGETQETARNQMRKKIREKELRRYKQQLEEDVKKE